jgi:hypothetical protein
MASDVDDLATAWQLERSDVNVVEDYFSAHPFRRAHRRKVFFAVPT